MRLFLSASEKGERLILFFQRQCHCAKKKSGIFDSRVQLNLLSYLQGLREMLARLRKIAREIKDSPQADMRIDLTDLITGCLVQNQCCSKSFGGFRQLSQ